VLPGGLSGTPGVLGFVARELPRGTALSLMGQYVPAGRAAGHPLLGRRLSGAEYERACALLDPLGLTLGWLQEGSDPDI
jgi:putative pyruvate formate lyase activating enzyme